ncbi:hypothetical protein M9Y10_023356 [Tritrichomonas musculus]|uniref:RING-type E3 ubiquitin transferase n=1 Tax=Tritrichomonas musculus TaxID=1915356 RepID=A0ABR2KUZ2_9EUKA
MHKAEEASDKNYEPKPDSNNGGEQKKTERWHCPICKDQLKSPVVSPCGHIFCWPCISKHLQNEENGNKICPVCHKPLDLEKIVPIYGQTNQAKDNEAPPPPKAERVETEEEIRERNRQNNQFFNQNGNNFNFEFGMFPFGASIGFTYRNGTGFQAYRGNNRQGFRNPLFIMFFVFLLPTIIMMFTSAMM